MKFKDLAYKRPNFDEIVEKISSFLDELENSASEEEFFDLHKKIEQEFAKFNELYTIAYIRNTINPKDSLYEEELA